MQKNHSKARIIARPATPPTTPPTMAPMLVPPSDFSESVAAPVAIADEVTRIDPFESVTVTTTILVKCSEVADDVASLDEEALEVGPVLVTVLGIGSALVEGSIDDEGLVDVDELGSAV